MSRSPATRRDRALLPTLVLMASSTAVVASLGAPLVPRIAAEEGVSLATAQWVLTVSFLTGAVATPLMGRLGSGPRRRPVVLGGLTAVLAGCVLAALPLGFGPMVVGRVLQGLGLTLTPVAIAVARDVVPEARRPAAIATLSVSTVTAAGLGYPLASFVVDLHGVAAAYWVGAVIAAISLGAACLVLPHNTLGRLSPVDLLGAMLLGGATAGLLLVLSQAASWGWTSARTCTVLAASLLLLALWTRWTLGFTRRAGREPLVDLRRAVQPGVLGANVTALLAGCSMYMLITLVVLAVQAPVDTGYGLGQPVTVAGLMLVPFSLASVLGSRVARLLVGRITEDALLPVGCSLLVIATLVLAGAHEHLWGNVLAMVVGGAGSGCSFAAVPGLIVRYVPPRETGSAMGFNQILRYLGFSAGSALVMAVLEMSGTTGGAVTSSGFVTAAAAAAGVAAVAAFGALWLGRMAWVSLPGTAS